MNSIFIISGMQESLSYCEIVTSIDKFAHSLWTVIVAMHESSLQVVAPHDLTCNDHSVIPADMDINNKVVFLSSLKKDLEECILHLRFRFWWRILVVNSDLSQHTYFINWDVE
jgi:hypothetical protein